MIFFQQIYQLLLFVLRCWGSSASRQPFVWFTPSRQSSSPRLLETQQWAVALWLPELEPSSLPSSFTWVIQLCVLHYHSDIWQFVRFLLLCLPCLCRTIFSTTAIHTDGNVSHLWSFSVCPVTRIVWKDFTRDFTTNAANMQVNGSTDYLHTHKMNCFTSSK